MYDTDLDRDYRDTRLKPTERYHLAERHLAPGLQTWADSWAASEQQIRENKFARQIEADVLRNFNRLAG
jgi:hypothetical protein